MKKLGAILFLIVLLLVANFIAQMILPTLRSDFIGKRFAYYYLVVAVMAVLLAVLVGLALLLGY